MSASGESSTTMHRLLHASGSHPIPPPNDPKKRHFTVDGGRYRQSGPRPKTGFLRQPALEGLTRSAWTDSPRQDWPETTFRRREAAAAAFGEEEGAALNDARVRVDCIKCFLS
ncbi:hypothetical protein F511_12555 [Dorcoceras hygrometricum]|uniref:Uncharacterized protein n=1 Tax=Dorcoceras hygrometricum TaxID=472368 RepID=A0A2Z7BXX6_9LAMI|nr:hypothetical protein F511_12555 [Dorcoceras hygrometricum]